ncbi:MAG TPA: TolC family protein [Fimbriimonadaceae bacterium]|nr:TolC family protein [Fimbriimonadaceae bacterium]
MSGLALISAAATLFSAQGDKLSLDEAIQIAMDGAFSVRIAKTDLSRAEQAIAQRRAQMGIRLTTDTTYTRFDKESRATFGEQSIVVRPIDSADTRLTLSMPVDISRNLGRFLSAAKLGLAASEKNVEAAKAQVKLAVRQSYFQVVKASWQVRVAQQSFTNAESRRAVAESRFRQGDVARIEVLRFETEVAQRRSELIAAQNQLSLSKNAFNNTLGRPIETPVELEDVAPTDPALPSVEDLVQSALESRPELDALEAHWKAQGVVRQAEETGDDPSLALSAVHTRNWQTAGFGAQSQSTVGTAVLSFPIVDSGLTRARVRSAMQEEEAAKLRWEQAKLGVTLDVRQAHTALVNALSRLNVTRSQVELATETYRLASLRYEAGEAIQLEVIDAQTQLVAAETSQVAAQYDVLSALAQLQFAVGKDEIELSTSADGTEDRNE